MMKIRSGRLGMAFWNSNIRVGNLGVEDWDWTFGNGRLGLKAEGWQWKIGSGRPDSGAVILVQHLVAGVTRCCCQDRTGTKLLLSITLCCRGTCPENCHACCTDDRCL